MRGAEARDVGRAAGGVPLVDERAVLVALVVAAVLGEVLLGVRLRQRVGVVLEHDPVLSVGVDLVEHVEHLAQRCGGVGLCARELLGAGQVGVGARILVELLTTDPVDEVDPDLPPAGVAVADEPAGALGGDGAEGEVAVVGAEPDQHQVDVVGRRDLRGTGRSGLRQYDRPPERSTGWPCLPAGRPSTRC